MTSREWPILGNDTGKPVVQIRKQADGKYREISGDNPMPISNNDFDTVVDALDKIHTELRLTNELLKGILQ